MRTFIPLMTLAALVATGSARAQPARRSTHALATVSASPAPPPALTETDASGLTADEVGRRAAASSFNVKAYEATLRAAAARVDEAWMGFVPKVTGVVRAMDLSNFSPPPIDLP